MPSVARWLGIGVLIVILWLWRGVVFVYLWKSFVVSVFGMPGLTIPSALGLLVVFSFAIPSPRSSKSDLDRPWNKLVVEDLSRGFMYPALALLTGWVIRQWL